MSACPASSICDGSIVSEGSGEVSDVELGSVVADMVESCGDGIVLCGCTGLGYENKWRCILFFDKPTSTNSNLFQHDRSAVTPGGTI